MERAVRARVMVGADHLVRLPDEVPPGEAEVIVFIPASARADRAERVAARKRLLGRLHGMATVAEDFDAPLPDHILAEFEGR